MTEPSAPFAVIVGVVCGLGELVVGYGLGAGTVETTVGLWVAGT